MKVGILSDTHNQVERTREAVTLLRAEGAEALFHCGDLTGMEIAEACATLPSYIVLGNNDLEARRLERVIRFGGGVCLGEGGEVSLGGKRIAVTHGHDGQQIRRLLAAAPDYLLLGHSHRREDRKSGRTRIINPGALHRAPQWTIALLDLAVDELYRVFHRCRLLGVELLFKVRDAWVLELALLGCSPSCQVVSNPKKPYKLLDVFRGRRPKMLRLFFGHNAQNGCIDFVGLVPTKLVP